MDHMFDFFLRKDQKHTRKNGEFCYKMAYICFHLDSYLFYLSLLSKWISDLVVLEHRFIFIEFQISSLCQSLGCQISVNSCIPIFKNHPQVIVDGA